MGETLNLLFRSRADGTYELQVKENWSGRTVTGSFVPPFENSQLNKLHKKLNKLNSSTNDLREIGQRLATPEAQRLLEQGGCAGRVVALEQRPGLVGQTLETDGIDRFGSDGIEVPAPDDPAEVYARTPACP